jgi:hypothetical protein
MRIDFPERRENEEEKKHFLQEYFPRKMRKLFIIGFFTQINNFIFWFTNGAEYFWKNILI